MPEPALHPDSGLTASELALVLAELESELRGARIVDAALLDGRDDLLLFFEAADRRLPLQVAPGGRRARICVTRQRFPKTAFATGPRPDRIAELLRGAVFAGLSQPEGERRFTLALEAPSRPLALECELFGNRGLWVLREADGTILALSRLPNVAGRTLRPGDPYQAPSARPPRGGEGPEPRFSHPPRVNDAIDRAYTALDVAEAADGERLEIERALSRELTRRRHRLEGLERQRTAMEDVSEVRLAADLLLAYGGSMPKGAKELRVPHPHRPDDELVIPRDLRVPPHVQAQALYKKARKHEDGREATDRQLAAARADVEALEDLRARLADEGQLPAIRDALERRGVLHAVRPPKPDAAQRKTRKETGGENLRRFVSSEGMAILIGRDDRQNDRLSTRIARGNDLWLHVGRGYAGSHVVVRVPKGKTASLETLLDAATLAVHFSKVRGATLEEVIYTQAKNVRKAKGMPAGKVLAAQTRAIRVRLEPDRLARLLSSADTADPPTR